jgi:hypothetical protein
MSGLRRFLLIGLVVCLMGEIGAMIWGYPLWSFSIVGSVIVVITFVSLARDGLHSPVPGRPDLSRDEPDRKE